MGLSDFLSQIGNDPKYVANIILWSLGLTFVGQQCLRSFFHMLKLLLVIAAVYGVLLVYTYLTQSRMLYLPNMPGRALTATPADIGFDYEDVSIETTDGGGNSRVVHSRAVFPRAALLSRQRGQHLSST